MTYSFFGHTRDRFIYVRTFISGFRRSIRNVLSSRFRKGDFVTFICNYCTPIV